MKASCIPLALFLLLPCLSPAQTPLIRSRSLEAFVEKDLHEARAEITSFGMNYGIQLRPMIRFRAGVMGTINREQSNPQYTALAADSLSAKTWTTRVSLMSLTGALEAEKPFYKRLSLVAGAELRAGYGNGARDSAVSNYNHSVYGGTGLFHYSSNPDESYSVLQIGLRPYLGARLKFGRFYTGLDLASIIYSTTPFHSTDFDFSWNPMSLHGRVSLGWRL